MPIKFLNDVAVDSSVLYVDTINNRVGVGVASPAVKLHAGSTSTSGVTTEEFRLQSGTSSGNGGTAIANLVTGNFGISGIYFGNNTTYSSQPVYLQYQRSSNVTTLQFDNIFKIDQNASSIFYINPSGNVGIGTTSPNSTLEVNGDVTIKNANGNNPTDAGSLYFNESGNTWGTDYYGFRINQQGASNYLNFQSANLTTVTDILTLARDTGNVGIGVTSNFTGYRLEVADGDIRASQAVAKISLGQLGSQGDAFFGASGLGAPTVGSQDYGFYSAHNAYRTSTGAWKHSRTSTIPSVRLLGSGGVSSGNQGFSFDYSANVGTADITWTNLMKILPSGNVGIGTTSPSYQLTLGGNAVGSTQGLRIDDPSNAAYGAHFSFSDTPNEVWIGGITNNTYNSAIGIHRDTTRAITIDVGGKVGIGTTSPSEKLEVSGKILATGGQIRAGSYLESFPSFSFANDTDTGMFSDTANQLEFATAGSSRVTINSSGNVGIGTTSPVTKLDVYGTSDTYLTVRNNGGSNAGIRMYGGGAGISHIWHDDTETDPPGIRFGTSANTATTPTTQLYIN
jgi:hypothetical protein